MVTIPLLSRDRPLRVVRFGWPVSNVWLLPDSPEGPFLVDSGFPTQWGSVLQTLKRHRLKPQDLSGILLTHRHIDHAGNAARFHERYGVAVYAHPADAAYLSGDRTPPPLAEPAGVVGALSKIENRFPAWIPDVIAMNPGDEISGLEVRWMPGHTLGSADSTGERSARKSEGR